MSNDINVDRWNDDWQPPLIQNIIHQQVIEDLAKAEKWGVRRQVQIDHTVKAINLLEERLDALKCMQKLDRLRAMAVSNYEDIKEPRGLRPEEILIVSASYDLWSQAMKKVQLATMDMTGDSHE